MAQTLGCAFLLEVFHQPHVTIRGPAMKCQVAPIWRRMCFCFGRTSGILPQGMRIALKIHMQEFFSVPDAVANKQALSVRGPIQGLQTRPTPDPGLLQQLTASEEK